MKGMRKISRGKGFSGLLNYAATGEDNEPGHGRLLGGTMAGTTPKALAREFKAVALLRPDIEKPVWHSSLRMPKNQDVDDETWSRIAVRYMELMDWPTDQSQWCIWKHDQDEHIHVIANRVQLDGKIYLGQNENLKNTRIIAQLEREFGLTITKGVEYDDQGKIVMPEKTQPKKPELEKALRTGDKPPRLVQQEVIAAALADRPTITAFLERLDAAGIEAIPNIASTGRMNGFAFRLDGIKFSGSELGAAFKWAALQKGMDYDQERDREELTRRKDAAASREIDDGATARPDQVARAAGGGAPIAGTSGGIGDGDTAVGRRTELDHANVGELGSAPQGDRIGTTSEREKPVADASTEGGRGVGVQKTGVSVAAERLAKIGGPAEERDLIAKRAAWHQQHAALAAPQYRLTLKDRVARDGKDRSHNLGKSKVSNGPETFYDATQVEAQLPVLRRSNTQGFDVYITPIDPTYHYILIDDMTGEAVEKMKADGYKPCLIQQSSEDNYQAVIKARREGRRDEQSIANQLVVDLNRKYGDPKISGVIRPFRMAGFSNKKPGRRDMFTVVKEAVTGLCERTMELLSSLRRKVDSDAAIKAAEALKAERIEKVATPAKHARYGPAREYQQQAHWFTKNGGVIDWSSVDYGVACEMLKRGFDRDDVEDAIREGSPALGERKYDPEVYVKRTVDAAVKKVGVVPTKGRRFDFPEPK